MIQYGTKVPNNTPQSLTYTFLDQNKNVLNLSNYVSVWLELKLYGQVYIVVPASFSNQTLGVVTTPFYTFTSPGVWDVQFYCLDGTNNKLYGESLQIVVKPNVDDLALTQNMYF